MKKIYIILTLLFPLAILNAQWETHKDLSSFSSDKKQNESIEETNNRFTLRSTNNAFQPDSALVYNSSGQLIGKKYFKLGSQGRDRFHTGFSALNDGKGTFVNDWIYREILDEKGNVLLHEERTLMDGTYWTGSKVENQYHETTNEKIYINRYSWNPVKNDWILQSHSRKVFLANTYQFISEIFQFDQAGNITSGYKSCQEYGLEDNLFKSSYMHPWDADEGRFVEYDKVWNDSTHSWDKQSVAHSLYSYTFLPSGNIDSRITTLQFSDSTQTRQDEKVVYKYNDKGLRTEITSYYADYTINGIEWVLSSQERTSFDTNNKPITQATFHWNSDEDKWENSIKFEYEYTNGFITSYVKAFGNYGLDSWIMSDKYIQKFDEAGRPTLYEGYVWNLDSLSVGHWLPTYRNISRYTGPDWKTYGERQYWNYAKEAWDFATKSITELDSNGNPSIVKDYQWEAGEWGISQIMVYYPYAPTTDVEIEEAKPINNEENTAIYAGKFTLALNIASDAIPSGTFDLILPLGFTLDQEATKLSNILSSKASATFTDKGNNIWTVTIAEKSLRSANNLVYRNILDVAYSVDENVASQKHEIVLKDMTLSLSSGGTIIKDEMKVSVAPKNVSSVEKEIILSNEINIINGILNIYTPQSEIVTIYSSLGQPVYTFKKQDGLHTIDAATLPQGVIILKGSSGWSSKLFNN